jgi:catechol 2,3-dioxygenase-like lactoylglutathione lyase family enzyme
MITGLRGTSIWSEDLNNLLPFYRDVLGLEVTTETPGFVVLGGLWLGTHSEVRGRNADPARHMIGLTSNDLTGDWKRLKDAGGRVHRGSDGLRYRMDRDAQGPGGQSGAAASVFPSGLSEVPKEIHSTSRSVTIWHRVESGSR